MGSFLPCFFDLSKVSLDLFDAIQGKTALHICAERDDADGCRILLAAGADPKIKDKNEKLPHQLPKTPAVIEQLGGNPLAITLRRKAEAEMELRALKIQQLTAKRRKASAQLDQLPKNTIIRINPNKFPNGLPSSLRPESKTSQAPPVVVQTVPQVTPPPVVMHPPVYNNPRKTGPYTYQRKATPTPTTENKVILPQDENQSEEKKQEFSLELPQDAKPSLPAKSESEDDDGSGSDSDG